MTRENELRAVALIRALGSLCNACASRGTSACDKCDARCANALLRDIEADERTKSKSRSALIPRMRSVAMQIGDAGRALAAPEIIMDGCTPQLKRWTLLRMERAGLIRRVVATSPGMLLPRYAWELRKE